MRIFLAFFPGAAAAAAAAAAAVILDRVEFFIHFSHSLLCSGSIKPSSLSTRASWRELVL
jgi:hypothetical protein